jgi:Uma2 family endonuclease
MEATTMAVPATKMSLADYMAWEELQPDRNEFHRGEVFAMVGARRGHATIVGNLSREIGNRLKGSPCRAFSEAAKVQIGIDTVVYPDVFVTCDRSFRPSDTVFAEPSLVIEVLSPTTKDHDKGRKFAPYRLLPSLREYVLIDPDTRDVQAFRRNTADEWVLHDMTDTDALVLPCIDATVPMAEVFDGIEPTA